MEAKTVLNISNTGSMPTFQMLRSTERKITALKEALRYDYAPKNMSDAASMKNAAYKPNPMQSKVVELKALSAKYNNGLISLDVYNSKLDSMLEYIASNGESFQMAS